MILSAHVGLISGMEREEVVVQSECGAVEYFIRIWSQKKARKSFFSCFSRDDALFVGCLLITSKGFSASESNDFLSSWRDLFSTYDRGLVRFSIGYSHTKYSEAFQEAVGQKKDCTALEQMKNSNYIHFINPTKKYREFSQSLIMMAINSHKEEGDIAEIEVIRNLKLLEKEIINHPIELSREDNYDSAQTRGLLARHGWSYTIFKEPNSPEEFPDFYLQLEKISDHVSTCAQQ
jgi:hypothetical protein